MSTNRMSHLLIMAVLVVLIPLTACAPAQLQASPPTLISPTTTGIPATPILAALTVTSTLDGLTSLPHRIQWEAKPSLPESQVSKVDFLIDGQLAFEEQHMPYYYGRDGGYLVTSFLPAGEHSFTVRVTARDGQSAESTVKAMVDVASAPPDGLADISWAREMTALERRKATSSAPPPAGNWGLTINSVGWMVHDPEGGGLLFDVEYQPGGIVELRPAIEKPPFPNTTGGAFCEEPDIPFLWSYIVSTDGKTLTLHPVGKDPCGDRIAILEGIWTRSEN